uniref:Fucolectin tachylectin-4 pentraxin-1 domain-containing protein n=1 Tax=Latimeria chalumnae TaxID=7897 RepID=H3AU79_LATCH
NIAFKGVATQSSVYDYRGVPEHAIDGNNDANYGGLSCTHTQLELSPWWRLDLQEKHSVNIVIITNRADCCSKRLSGVQVQNAQHSPYQVDKMNDRCMPLDSVDFPGPTVRFSCNGRAGRYVTILIPNRKEYLSLCEVEVFGSVIRGQVFGQTNGKISDLIPGAPNIALKGIATQSSLYDYRGAPEHAIDGNVDANYYGLSCSHTQLEFSPFWRVDLLQTYAIYIVVITNRADCCSERLRGVEVEVGDFVNSDGKENTRCTSWESVEFPEPITYFNCNGRIGSNIKVVIPNRVEYLTLCEVEVYGSVVEFQSAVHSPGGRYCTTVICFKKRFNLARGDGSMRYRCLEIPAYFTMGGENIALKGTATQSSLHDNGGRPENAIDGNKDAVYGGQSCSHTQIEQNPWWRLDLKEIHAIDIVVITNRNDCCPERLKGVEVWVGSSIDNSGADSFQCIPWELVDFPGPTFHFGCNGKKGRYVTVVIPNREDYLTLCEVEVFRHDDIAKKVSRCMVLPWKEEVQHENAVTTRRNKFVHQIQSTGESIALNGTATQSSLYDYRGHPENAIDGNKDATYGGQSCSHTQSEHSPWWRLDLKEIHAIDIVVITNRKDCCQKRLRGVEVRVGDFLNNNGADNFQCTPWEPVDFSGPTFHFGCNGKKGRYVTVVIPNREDYLTLCEVEVFGSVTDSHNPDVENQCVTQGCPNIALKGVATQSSMYDYRGAPEHAIDGNNNSSYGGKSCTHTKLEFSPWWRLDLQENHAINIVIITNRVDCCSERLRGVEVWVGSSPEINDINSFKCTPWTSVEFPKPRLRFSCNGRNVRYITVTIPNRKEYLTLCEVEVFASCPHDLIPDGK